MEKADIEKLVAEVQQGSEQAFASLYDEFADRIYKFISFKTSDPEHAEDLLQEVFVKAWHGCKKLELKDLNFSAWLYTVASNTVNDHFRKVYRRPQTVSLDPIFDTAADNDTSDLVNSSLDAVLLHKALSELPINYKQVLELRFIQELSVEETAKVLKKNSVSVRVLQHRAMKKLERIFKHHETR